jgi:hypothetical protein
MLSPPGQCGNPTSSSRGKLGGSNDNSRMRNQDHERRWIIANNGDRANFGGNAKSDENGNTSGNEEYQDQGPVDPFNLHGYVTAIRNVCVSGSQASNRPEVGFRGTYHMFERKYREQNIKVRQLVILCVEIDSSFRLYGRRRAYCPV